MPTTRRPGLLLLALLAAGIAHADSRFFESLAGQHEDDAESGLYQRGYRNVGIEKEHGETLRYFWNAGTGDCEVLAARDGRVRQVTAVSRSVCASMERGAGGHGAEHRAADEPLPREISGLVGNKRQDADDKLGKLGFRKLDGEKSSGSTRGLWWNAANRQCLGVEAKDGRIRRIEREDRSTCD